MLLEKKVTYILKVIFNCNDSRIWISKHTKRNTIIMLTMASGFNINGVPFSAPNKQQFYMHIKVVLRIFV